MYFRYLGTLIIIMLYISCNPKTSKHLVENHKSYHEQVIENYRNNEHLNLSEEELNQISFYPINPAFDCDCNFTMSTEQEVINMATYSGKTKIFKKYGVASCPILNKNIDIALYLSSSPLALKDYLFLPMMDETSGDTTYGGGRYIELKKSDIQNGKIHIDFNRLYNPYCAFRDGFSCPVPPQENHLSVAIEAGEKTFGGSH